MIFRVLGASKPISRHLFENPPCRTTDCDFSSLVLRSSCVPVRYCPQIVVDLFDITVMPPVLDPSKSKVDGLAFLGLSLARKSDQGHPYSVTHQTAFDLNKVLDRDYKYIFSTSDDGWLVGGGEPGPPASYKLPAPDSAHVEIIRLGTYRPEWGGVSQYGVIAALEAGDILIPQIEVVPTAVVANPDAPPELEIRFDMEPKVPVDLATPTTTPGEDGVPQLPINWQLRFLHNQLFRRFIFPSRFCPGAFHSTILRKAEFRSEKHKADYFAHCGKICEMWKKLGVQPLIPNLKNDTSNIARVYCVDASSGQVVNDGRYQSGLYLFTDRTTITHHFAPNFLPPYDTPEKRKIILDILKEEWDEKTLSWKPVVGRDGTEMLTDGHCAPFLCFPSA